MESKGPHSPIKGTSEVVAPDNALRPLSMPIDQSPFNFKDSAGISHGNNQNGNGNENSDSETMNSKPQNHTKSAYDHNLQQNNRLHYCKSYSFAESAAGELHLHINQQSGEQKLFHHPRLEHYDPSSGHARTHLATQMDQSSIGVSASTAYPSPKQRAQSSEMDVNFSFPSRSSQNKLNNDDPSPQTTSESSQVGSHMVPKRRRAFTTGLTSREELASSFVGDIPSVSPRGNNGSVSSMEEGYVLPFIMHNAAEARIHQDETEECCNLSVGTDGNNSCISTSTSESSICTCNSLDEENDASESDVDDSVTTSFSSSTTLSSNFTSSVEGASFATPPGLTSMVTDMRRRHDSNNVNTYDPNNTTISPLSSGNHDIWPPSPVTATLYTKISPSSTKLISRLITFISIYIILFSGSTINNNSSNASLSPSRNTTKQANQASDIDTLSSPSKKGTNSYNFVSQPHQVTDFGNWGIHIQDDIGNSVLKPSIKDSRVKKDGIISSEKIRKKRRPALTQAQSLTNNSNGLHHSHPKLKTTHSGERAKEQKKGKESSSILHKTNQFVLTDDEIRHAFLPQSSPLDEDLQSLEGENIKDAALVSLAWFCLFLIGSEAIFSEVRKRKCQKLRYSS